MMNADAIGRGEPRHAVGLAHDPGVDRPGAATLSRIG